MKTQTEESTINLIKNIGLLKRVVRTGWVLKGIKNSESVADHTFRVAMMAAIFASKFKLDQSKLVLMALVHDLGEVFIGDIKWETGKKVVGLQEEKHRDEEKSLRMLFNNSDYHQLIELWKEFNEQKTREAQLLKEIDKLEMAFQSYEYEEDGFDKNKLNEFWENSEKYLIGGKLELIFRNLQKKRDLLNRNK